MAFSYMNVKLDTANNVMMCGTVEVPMLPRQDTDLAQVLGIKRLHNTRMFLQSTFICQSCGEQLKSYRDYTGDGLESIYHLVFCRSCKQVVAKIRTRDSDVDAYHTRYAMTSNVVFIPGEDKSVDQVRVALLPKCLLLELNGHRRDYTYLFGLLASALSNGPGGSSTVISNLTHPFRSLIWSGLISPNESIRGMWGWVNQSNSTLIGIHPRLTQGMGASGMDEYSSWVESSSVDGTLYQWERAALRDLVVVLSGNRMRSAQAGSLDMIPADRLAAYRSDPMIIANIPFLNSTTTISSATVAQVKELTNRFNRQLRHKQN